MSWTNNYSAWNYVVGKRKKSQEKPKPVITIDSDEGEDIKEVRQFNQKLDPEVVIIDDKPVFQPSVRLHVRIHTDLHKS